MIAYKLLALCCLLLVQKKGIHTSEETSREDSVDVIQQHIASRDHHYVNSGEFDNLTVGLPSIFDNPWGRTFIKNVIERFHQQREDNHSQFGAIYLANIDNLNSFDPQIYPQINDRPIIDNHYPTSPYNRADRGNYVASGPTRVNRTMIHAEKLLLNELTHLWNAYYNRNSRRPNFILVYSWIMPCPDCTNMIIERLRQHPFIDVQYRVVAYTLSGTTFLPYMTTESIERSKADLRSNGLSVWQERCQRPITNYTRYDEEMGNVLPSVIITKKKTIKENVIFENENEPFKYDSAMDTCQISDLFQGCLLNCLTPNVFCSTKQAMQLATKVALINELTLACAKLDFQTCTKNWIKENIGIAISCIRHDEIEDTIVKCSTTCMEKPLSNPLNPHQPLLNPDLLTDFSKLSLFIKPDLSSSCNDIRTDGFLCSRFSRDSFTAGNTLCRVGDKCGHKGYSYSWCYTDFSDNWDYCCTGTCSYAQHTDYLWCTSGSKWQYCGNGGTMGIKGRKCVNGFPCGMHQEIGKANYYWCYVDMNKNWERCCQPNDPCSRKGEPYNWCYTGYKKRTSWKHCAALEHLF